MSTLKQFLLIISFVYTGCASAPVAELSIANTSLSKEISKGLVSSQVGAFENNFDAIAGNVFYVRPINGTCQKNEGLSFDLYREVKKESCKPTPQRLPVVKFQSTVDGNWEGSATAFFSHLGLQQGAKAEVMVMNLHSNLLDEKTCVDFKALEKVPDDPSACYIIYAKGTTVSSVTSKIYVSSGKSGLLQTPFIQVGGKSYAAVSNFSNELKILFYPYYNLHDVMKAKKVAKETICKKINDNAEIDRFCETSSTKVVPQAIFEMLSKKELFELDVTEGSKPLNKIDFKIRNWPINKK